MYTSDNYHALVGGDDSGANKAFRYFDPAATDDNGVQILSHWQSAWIGIQEHEPKERLRRLNLQLVGDVHVDVLTDFSTIPAAGFNVTGGVAGYRFARVRPETRGRYHSVKLSSVVGGIPFSLNAIELVIRGGKEH
jgi:hypothetical protein